MYAHFRAFERCGTAVSAVVLTGTLGLLAGVLPASAADYRHAFLTSVTGPGDFATWPDAEPGTTGLAAADSICQSRAATAGLPNPGAFRAWASDSLDDAWCRAQGLTGRRDTACDGASLPGAGPWARVGDEVLWAADLDALAGSVGPLIPLDRDEFGQPTGEDSLVWTATDATGRASDPFGGQFCNDWTSADGGQISVAGTSHATRPAWTTSFLASCDSTRALVCVETGSPGDRPPVAEIGPAALGFVTDTRGTGDFGSWPTADGEAGVAAADAICRAEAAAARLPNPGSFVAVISTATAPARDRLPANLAWTRLDGVGIALGRADLFDGDLAAPIPLTPSGVYLPVVTGYSDAVWTGTSSGGSGFADYDCGGWTSSALDDMGLAGEPQAAAANWTDSMPQSCAAELPIYCLSTVEMLLFENFEQPELWRWEQVAE